MNFGNRTLALAVATGLSCALGASQVLAGQVEPLPGPQGRGAEIEEIFLPPAVPMDCPDGIEYATPSRTVLQVIDLEVHRWLEYDMQGGGLCVVQTRPRQQVLSAGQTADLLERSMQWQEQLPDPENMEILSADHPSLLALQEDNVPLRLPPEGWEAPAGPDVEYQPPLPPSREQLAQSSNDAVSQPVPPAPAWQPVSERPEAVIGTDERVRVNLATVQTYPWNTIGFHLHQYPNLETYRCTAFLVGPRLALTNGHCIYNVDRGGYLRAAEFSPGQFQSGQGESIIRPFGTLAAYRFRTNTGWVNDGLSIYDYGALQFSRDFGGITTFMPLVFDDVPGSIINTSGYPARVHLGTPTQENPTFAQWRSSSTSTSIGGTDDRLLLHNADTSQGHSGSPLWRLISGQRRVVAIHCCGSSQVNTGPRLVAQNESIIQGWLEWVPPGNPGNGDDFGVLSSTSGVGGWTANSTGATRQVGEEDHCAFSGGRSMWRSWTSPASRPVQFFMTNTDFDVLLAAYTGDEVGLTQEIACDGSVGTDNNIVFPATKGQTYHIAVDGFAGAVGGFRLNWRIAPPPNDDFANAWAMSGFSGTDFGDNHGATAEPGEPNVCNMTTTTTTTAWWTFTAPPEPGVLTVNSSGSDFDVLLEAFTGSSVGNLQSVACDGSVGTQNQIQFSTTPGTIYRIVVAGWNGAMGDIQLNWNWQTGVDNIFRDRFE